MHTMMAKVGRRRHGVRCKNSWLHTIREWTKIVNTEQLFHLAIGMANFDKLTVNLQ